MSQDTEDFTLDVDPINWAVGAVLQKEQERLLRVIGYTSRALTETERRYCITGMIFGLKHYRQYLLGRQFTIRTDHAALSYLHTAKDLIGQQARWVDLMSEYIFTIQHRAGKSHSNADALSRILSCEEDGEPCKQCHKHIRDQVSEDTETKEDRVEYSRVSVLQVTLVDSWTPSPRTSATPSAMLTLTRSIYKIPPHLCQGTAATPPHLPSPKNS